MHFTDLNHPDLANMKIDQQVKSIIEDTIRLIDEYEEKIENINRKDTKWDKIVFITLAISGVIIALGVLILIFG